MDRSKRIAIAVLAGVGTVGVGLASAATLNGITSNKLGADDSVVASCDTDGVTVSYSNTYDSASGRYKTTGVTVASVDAGCTGESISATLKDSSSNPVFTGTVGGTSVSMTLALASAPFAEDVTGIAIVITG